MIPYVIPYIPAAIILVKQMVSLGNITVCIPQWPIHSALIFGLTLGMFAGALLSWGFLTSLFKARDPLLDVQEVAF